LSQQVVAMRNIDFIREGRTILSDVSLTIGSSEHWVILGKNGSGKTTMLELMNAYQFPSRGKVEVLGRTYGECDVREVRRQIGYISQSLFEKLGAADPVWEAVATGAFAFLRFYEVIPAAVKDKAHAMLERVRLGHVANQPLATLSQGERKKVLLARAMMSDPQLLIMDEPCSGLDLYERERLLADIEDLGRGDLTIVYVTHHIEEIMPVFTHVALIEQGRIVASGEKRNVLNEENLLKAYQVQVKVDWFHDRPWIKVLG